MEMFWFVFQWTLIIGFTINVVFIVLPWLAMIWPGWDVIRPGRG